MKTSADNIFHVAFNIIGCTALCGCRTILNVSSISIYYESLPVPLCQLPQARFQIILWSLSWFSLKFRPFRPVYCQSLPAHFSTSVLHHPPIKVSVFLRSFLHLVHLQQISSSSFVQLIRPMMDYACPVCRHAADSHLKRLQHVQSKMLAYYCWGTLVR